jgi:hypothetical protein
MQSYGDGRMTKLLTKQQKLVQKELNKWEKILEEEGLRVISPKTVEKDWWREDLNRRTK